MFDSGKEFFAFFHQCKISGFCLVVKQNFFVKKRKKMNYFINLTDFFHLWFQLRTLNLEPKTFLLTADCRLNAKPDRYSFEYFDQAQYKYCGLGNWDLFVFWCLFFVIFTISLNPQEIFQQQIWAFLLKYFVFLFQIS